MVARQSKPTISLPRGAGLKKEPRPAGNEALFLMTTFMPKDY